MWPTLEVRWFFKGSIPPGVQAWFQHGERPPETQPARVDYYLQPSSVNSLGIKLREGRIEIKQRQSQYGEIRFHERVRGAVEHWRKWSFELATSGYEIIAGFTRQSNWIGVHKERQLQRFKITPDRIVVATATQVVPDQACDLELTSLRAAGMAWWSVGLEAFGNEADLKESLMLTAGQLLASREPPILEIQDSFAYPGWLAQIVTGA